MNKHVQPRGETGKLPVKKRPPRLPRPIDKRDIIKDNDIVRIKGDMDRTFLVLVIVLICFGSVMVFSASYAYALASEGDSYFFIKKQIGWVAVGLSAMFFIANVVDVNLIKKFTKTYFWGVVAALVAVLIMGTAEGEAKRWLAIPGIPFAVQLSEFMKLGIVLILAKNFSHSLPLSMPL